MTSISWALHSYRYWTTIPCPNIDVLLNIFIVAHNSFVEKKEALLWSALHTSFSVEKSWKISLYRTMALSNPKTGLDCPLFANILDRCYMVADHVTRIILIAGNFQNKISLNFVMLRRSEEVNKSENTEVKYYMKSKGKHCFRERRKQLEFSGWKLICNSIPKILSHTVEAWFYIARRPNTIALETSLSVSITSLSATTESMQTLTSAIVFNAVIISSIARHINRQYVNENLTKMITFVNAYESLKSKRMGFHQSFGYLFLIFGLPGIFLYIYAFGLDSMTVKRSKLGQNVCQNVKVRAFCNEYLNSNYCVLHGNESISQKLTKLIAAFI